MSTNAVSAASQAQSINIQMPAQPDLTSAQESVFGQIYQENTNQFATLQTAQMLAGLLGGSVVDMSSQWTGGSQTSQYGISLPGGGPVLNAGLIAERCADCGVQAGLSGALVEAGSLSGQTISASDAWSKVLANASQSTAPSSSDTTLSQPVTTQVTTAPTAQTSTTQVATTQTAPTPAVSVAQPDAATALTVPVSAAPVTTSSAAIASADPGTQTNTQNIGKVADAAKQFESLLITQMLKSARESDSEWLGAGEEDSSGVSPVELAEQQFGQALAQQGGFGLARLVVDGLNQTPSTVATPSQSQQTPVSNRTGSHS